MKKVTCSEKTILSIGQCSFDQNSITSVIQSIKPGFKVHTCHSISEALSALAAQHFDLILLNRIFDRTGEEGIALLRTLKGSPETAHIPCLLVSNLPEAQERAHKLGALAGFGKAQLHDKRTTALLERYLLNGE